MVPEPTSKTELRPDNDHCRCAPVLCWNVMSNHIAALRHLSAVEQTGGIAADGSTQPDSKLMQPGASLSSPCTCMCRTWRTQRCSGLIDLQAQIPLESPRKSLFPIVYRNLDQVGSDKCTDVGNTLVSVLAIAGDRNISVL